MNSLFTMPKKESVFTTIELEFNSQVDLDFIEQGITVHIIRLTTSLQLATQKGWTMKYKSIVDTGNPITVIPNSVWQKAHVDWLLPHASVLRGIGSGKVSGKLGNITFILIDKATTSPLIKAKALLLDDDSVPFLIGFEDILTDLKMVCDYKNRTAFFRIPSDEFGKK